MTNEVNVKIAFSRSNNYTAGTYLHISRLSCEPPAGVPLCTRFLSIAIQWKAADVVSRGSTFFLTVAQPNRTGSFLTKAGITCSNQLLIGSPWPSHYVSLNPKDNP